MLYSIPRLEISRASRPSPAPGTKQAGGLSIIGHGKLLKQYYSHAPLSCISSYLEKMKALHTTRGNKIENIKQMYLFSQRLGNKASSSSSIGL